MADFGPDIADQVVAACQAGADEIAAGLQRTFDSALKLEVGAAAAYEPDSPPEGFDGPGLAVLLKVGELGALCLLAESSGVIPAWYANPDPTGKSKLTTLAQELGMLVLPEDFMPDDFRAARVEGLREAVDRASLGDGPRMVPLQLATESGTSATLYVIWPATQPEKMFEAPAAASEEPSASAPVAETPKPSPATTPAAQPTSQPSQPARTPGQKLTFESLPSYSRSLLRTEVPVSVTLASKRQPISRVIELGPGSIIQFDKACEEMLTLEVAGHTIAEGEAVKVGEKFGIRLTALMLPEERFHSVRPS